MTSSAQPDNSGAQGKKPRRLIVIGVIIMIVALIAAVVMWAINRNSDGQDDTAAPAPSTSAPVPVPGGDTPGAQLESEQRSWPDPLGDFDDSQWSTPGEYSVDHFHNRPVLTPYNHDGDLPEKADLVENMNSCSDDEVLLDGTTQQQYVNARFLTVNSQAGPTTMNRDVPGGYAHSPQGAITAALNQMSYGMYGQGDEVGEEIDKKLWTTSETVQDELSTKRPAEERDLTAFRPDSIPGPWGYKVTTCSENIVVVDVVTKQPEEFGSEESDFAVSVTLAWRDGDWVPDFSGNSDNDIKTTRSVDADDYTEVRYQ